MDRKVVENFAFNFAYQILLFLVPVVTTPYVSRCLGVDNVGIYSFTSSVCSYFGLAITFGFHVYGQREIAKAQYQRDTVSRILIDIQLKKLVVSIIVICVYFIFSIIQKRYSELYIIQIFTLISVFFDISYFYQGLELYRVSLIRNGFVKILGVLFICVFVHAEEDLWKYILICCFVNLFGNLFLWVGLNKYIDLISFSDFHFFENFKVIFELFIPIISVQLYFNIDKTMLGMLCEGPTENGYYEQALKIIRICQTVITSIGGVLVSSISRMLVSNDKAKIKETIQGAIRLGLFLSIPMVLELAATAEVFVPWFFGDGYDQVAILLVILSPILVFSAISNIAGNGVLIPTNKHKYVSLAATMGAGVNILFNFIFIPKLLSKGAAIASVIAEIVVLIVQWICAKEYIGIKKVVRSLFKYALCGTIMFIVLIILKKLMAGFVSDFVLTVVLALSGFTVYLFMIFAIRDDMLKQLLKFKRN